MTPAQNSLTSFNGQSPVTSMSSREIADLVESRHDNVKRAIERCAEKGVLTLPPTEEVSNEGPGPKTITTYLLDKRSTLIVVAQLSPEFTARVIDRWQELEQAAQPPQTPGRTTLKSIMGDFKVSTIEIAQALGIPHEIVLKGVRCHRFSGAISDEGAVEHRRTHPQNGLAYREFLLSPPTFWAWPPLSAPVRDPSWSTSCWRWNWTWTPPYGKRTCSA